MHQIKYAGHTLVTGSDIAHAVLAYARALASNNDSATITIPVLHDDGSVMTAELLIGPASQLISEPWQSSAPEIADADVVSHLSEATIKLSTPRAVPEETGAISPVDDGDLEHAASAVED